jgi:hypothetical protein
MLALALAVAVALPGQGLLVPGKSLAGVRLGDTPAAVQARYGGDYRVCPDCRSSTWFYMAPSLEHGLSVSFRGGRVSAVSTLGIPPGWRTAQGLKIGQDVTRAHALYGRMKLRVCVGFEALSRRRANVVTTIYGVESYVAGFALTRPSEPVCR